MKFFSVTTREIDIALAVTLVAIVFIGLIVVFNQPAAAQQPWYLSNPARNLVSYGPQYMPNSSTDVWTATTWVDYIHIANTSASAVTVRVSDKSTNCNSGACEIIPTVSVAADTVYTVRIDGGIRFDGGVNVQASAANAVVTFVRGAQY